MATKKVAIEEIPDKDMLKAGNILHEDMGEIIMTEDEYRDAIQKGGEPPLARQKTAKNPPKTFPATTKSKQSKAETTAATKNTTVLDNPEQQIKVKMRATLLTTLETGEKVTNNQTWTTILQTHII